MLIHVINDFSQAKWLIHLLFLWKIKENWFIRCVSLLIKGISFLFKYSAWADALGLISWSNCNWVYAFLFECFIFIFLSAYFCLVASASKNWTLLEWTFSFKCICTRIEGSRRSICHKPLRIARSISLESFLRLIFLKLLRIWFSSLDE